jgi:hypothetical protein
MRDTWVKWFRITCFAMICLIGGIVIIWGYRNDNSNDPVVKRYLSCVSREWNERHLYSRPPEPVSKAITEKCTREARSVP